MPRCCSTIEYIDKVYYERIKRQTCERIRDKRTRGTQSVPLPEEERESIYAIPKRHPEIGYRKLTWMMID